MKTKLFLLACLFLGFGLQSCDDDNINVDQKFEDALQTLYPEAKNVIWEKENNKYYVAEFWLNELEHDVWFTKQADWYKTEIDLPYSMLPEAVKESHESGEYADCRIDDVDQFDYPNKETVYIIEVEMGNKDYDLHYSPGGELIQAVKDR